MENKNLLECRHVIYCPRPDDQSPDLHVAKLIEHTPQGPKPKLKFFYDFKKPFYVARFDRREYKQKKELELLENLDQYKATNYERVEVAAQALDINLRFSDPRKVMNSPYLYGNDISSTSWIKYQYMKKNDKFSFAEVAVFDIETDMIDDVGSLTMATLSFKEHVYTACLTRVFKDTQDKTAIKNKLRDKFSYYLGDYELKRRIKWEIDVFDKPHEIILELFRRAHLWQPDLIAIWNMDFDLPIVIKTLEEAGIDPKDVFSDPTIPEPYRHFKYHQGPATMTTNDGVVKNKSPFERWHWVDTPAGFQFIDAMCLYYDLRKAKQKEPSYSLDYTLEKNLGIRKLKFKESDHIPANTPDWHKFMQFNYIYEYVIYNVFDCISVEELDERTLDVKLSYAHSVKCTDIKNFSSQPRRVMDMVHWDLLENGKVSGCSGDLVNELDKECVPLKGWIITLAAHLIKENDNKLIKHGERLAHCVHVDVGDLDIAASYPNGISVFNISRSTTLRELCSIEGLSFDQTVRPNSINLSGGVTNAVKFMTDMFKAPTLFQIAAEYERQQKLMKAIA